MTPPDITFKDRVICQAYRFRVYGTVACIFGIPPLLMLVFIAVRFHSLVLTTAPDVEYFSNVIVWTVILGVGVLLYEWLFAAPAVDAFLDREIKKLSESHE